MEPSERGPARRPAARRAVATTRFPITAVLDAFEVWQRGPSPRRLAVLRRALLGVAEAAGATGAYLEVEAEPLRPISIGVGSIRRRPAEKAPGARFDLTADRGRVHLGRLWLDSSGPDAATAARALGRSLQASWSDEERRFSIERLQALDAATRAVASVLSVDRVLQVITDRVRELVRAEYAAIGTVDQEGEIDRFITSGMSRLERERIGSPPRGHGLLGILIREQRVIRVPDIAADPRRHGFPPHHPAMHSFLGAPLVVRGRVAGNLYLTNKIGIDRFTEEDQAIVETFALHAAIAIDNARLHEQVQRLAVVEERERIGKDLHDGIIQAIYAVGLSLEDVPDLMETDGAEAIVRVDRAIENLNLAIRDIRNFIFGLRPELLEQAGLHAGLAALADEFRLNTMVDVDLVLDGRAAVDLAEEETIQLLHIAREALSNVARHSRATRATIELSAPDDTIRLVIADNGRGFTAGVARGPGHQGLVNMRGRAQGLGGGLEIESEPGHGTRIIVSVPRLDGEAERR